MIPFKHHPAVLATTLLLAVAHAPANAQKTIRLTAAAGHPPVFLWVKHLDDVFIPEVDRRLALTGNYKIDWTKAWGGTLVKLGSESKGMGDGVVDLGVVATVFETPRFPLQSISFYAPFGSDRVDLVSNTISDLQKSVPAMSDAWTKNGLKYLAGVSLDSYHIWSTFPITKFEDLNGKKISAPGPAANWVKGTGAVGVAGTLNTYYEDIKSGVSDGAIVFATAAWGLKFHEVAPYVTKVNFGAQFGGGIAINKRRFDGLPPEVQTAIVEAGKKYEVEYPKAQTALVAQRFKEMAADGAKVSELSESERKRWADALSPVAKIWAADMQSKGLPADQVLNGYMSNLIKGGANVPRDWSK
jgi:TRAP-type transport system periplasmic protein